jgi:type II secretory pathway component PulC
MKTFQVLIYLIAFTCFSIASFADGSTVSDQEQQKALNDVNEILTKARAVPNFENGKPAGYTITQPAQGNLYQRFGLKDGDVITTVDGQQVRDPQEAFQKLNEMQPPHVEAIIDLQQEALPNPQDVNVDQQSRSPAQDQ